MAAAGGERHEPWDPGLQPERTTLAWVRTGLGFVAVSLLTARLARGTGLVAVAVAVTGTLVSAVLLWVQTHGHGRRDAALRRGVPPPAIAPVAVATGLTVALAVTALALVLLAAAADRRA